MSAARCVAAPVLVLVLGLAGCGLNPVLPTPARYALASPPSAPAVVLSAAAGASPPGTVFGRAVRVGRVSAPAWMDESTISYQLNFRDPNRRAVYRDSRWIAAPASLFETRLRERIGVSNAPDAPTLQVELQEWTQIFTDPGHSDVLVRFRASLSPPVADGAAQVKEFSVQRAAPAANAQGAVAGLSLASEEALDALGAWLASVH